MKSHSTADARPNQLQKIVLPALFHLRCPSQSHQRSARGRTHTSDDSYIYQLSLVVATATISYNMYVHSNTEVFAVVSTFLRCIHMLCTTNTSVGGRAKVGERRGASDRYVHSNTAVPAEVSTFFLFIDLIYVSSRAPVRNVFSSRLVRIFSGGERATADKRRHTSKKVKPLK